MSRDERYAELRRLCRAETELRAQLADVRRRQAQLVVEVVEQPRQSFGRLARRLARDLGFDAFDPAARKRVEEMLKKRVQRARRGGDMRPCDPR